MAGILISDKPNGSVDNVTLKNTLGFNLTDPEHLISISENVDIRVNVLEKDILLEDIYDHQLIKVFTSVLPFRISFTTIGIDPYGPGSPAPIGIAVIGYSNYIL